MTAAPTTETLDPLRHHHEHQHLHSAFGNDTFGKRAESVARFFGTPQYILGQSVIVVLWIAVNAVATALRWDPYPFILLNLAFSTQAAYAAPLILLAQTRQADRDKAIEVSGAKHAEELSGQQLKLLQENTELTERVAQLTEQIERLTSEIHQRVIKQ